MTQEKRKLRVRDDYGGYTLEGIYQLAHPYIKEECEKAGILIIPRHVFSQIVREYFEICFTYAIYRFREVKVFWNFGWIYCYKVLCTRKNIYCWRTYKNEDGKVVRERYLDERFLNSGYYYSMYWELPKKYLMRKKRKFVFKLSKRWSKKIFQMIDEGNDYPEGKW